jgi:hypothetical protein
MSMKFLMNVETIMKMLMFWNDLFELDIFLRCDEYYIDYEMLIGLLWNWAADEWLYEY